MGISASTSGTGRWNKRQKPTADGKTRSGGCAADHTGLAKDGDRERTDPMTTGLEKRRQKKPVADTTGRGTWTGEPPPQIRTAEKGAGSRRHDGYAGPSRRGQRSSSLRRAENSSRRFSPGPGAGRRGIQPQPPFLKTQRMTKNMTMMPRTANNGPGI